MKNTAKLILTACMLILLSNISRAQIVPVVDAVVKATQEAAIKSTGAVLSKTAANAAVGNTGQGAMSLLETAENTIQQIDKAAVNDGGKKVIATLQSTKPSAIIGEEGNIKISEKVIYPEVKEVLQDRILIFVEDYVKFPSYNEVFKPYVKEVVHFETPSKAYDYFMKHNKLEKFIVITDIGFVNAPSSVENGIALLEKIKSVDNTVPVISLSSDGAKIFDGYVATWKLTAEPWYPEIVAGMVKQIPNIKKGRLF